VLILVYALAAWFNLHPAHRRVRRCAPEQSVLPTRWACCPTSGLQRRLWRDKLGQISLATTTLFWGVGQPALHRAGLGAAALGYSTTQASALVGVVAIGTAVGAVVASMRMRLDAPPRDAAGHRHGPAGGLMNFIDNVWLAVPFLICWAAWAASWWCP
jgi:hypothetical protein